MLELPDDEKYDRVKQVQVNNVLYQYPIGPDSGRIRLLSNLVEGDISINEMAQIPNKRIGFEMINYHNKAVFIVGGFRS